MKSLILALSLLAVTAEAAVNIKLDEASGKTEFLAVGNPGFLKIRGKGAPAQGDLSVDEGKLKGTLTFNLNSLDTEMELRNTHMKDKYLETKKYPTAKLIIENQKLPADWKIESPEIKDQKMNATLELHGVKKPVAVEYNINPDGTLTAKFVLKITDYDIGIPSFMGVTVAEKVDVEVQSALKQVN